MKNPLVTISIPTYNSAKSLKKCLKAIKSQTYRNLEIIIIDKNSKDKTRTIAKDFGIRNVKDNSGSLLESRYEGAKTAKGKYVLILDSDQILERNVIERAVNKCEKEKFKMLALEEFVYKSRTVLEKLFEMDRKVINKVNDLSPYTGVIMPRFFERNFLVKAYERIPKSIYPHTGGPDHALVYYEAWKMDKKIGVLPDAVRHIEPETFKELLPKFFRWGYTSVDAHFGKYDHLMVKKERFRTGLFSKGIFIESIGSIFLLILKGMAFKLGFYLGKFDRRLKLPRRY